MLQEKESLLARSVSSGNLKPIGNVETVVGGGSGTFDHDFWEFTMSTRSWKRKTKTQKYKLYAFEKAKQETLDKFGMVHSNPSSREPDDWNFTNKGSNESSNEWIERRTSFLQRRDKEILNGLKNGKMKLPNFKS